MISLIGLVLSVGFADSLNPSTIGPAVYIAAGDRAARRLLLFIVGAYAVSAGAGVALIVGPAHALLTKRPAPHTEHVAEIVGGVVLLAIAAALWLLRARLPHRKRDEASPTRRPAALLGAAIIAIELPTAFPYFAVLAAIAASGERLLTQVLLVLLFNLAFVAPLLAILAVRQVAGDGAVARLHALRQAIERHEVLLAVALMLGLAAVLLTLGATGLSNG